jgi:hypothetical protein
LGLDNFQQYKRNFGMSFFDLVKQKTPIFQLLWVLKFDKSYNLWSFGQFALKLHNLYLLVAVLKNRVQLRYVQDGILCWQWQQTLTEFEFFKPTFYIWFIRNFKIFKCFQSHWEVFAPNKLDTSFSCFTIRLEQKYYKSILCIHFEF